MGELPEYLGKTVILPVLPLITPLLPTLEWLKWSRLTWIWQSQEIILYIGNSICIKLSEYMGKTAVLPKLIPQIWQSEKFKPFPVLECMSSNGALELD